MHIDYSVDLNRCIGSKCPFEGTFFGLVAPRHNRLDMQTKQFFGVLFYLKNVAKSQWAVIIFLRPSKTF